MIRLRDYQRELVDKCSGNDNPLIQADTGAGKTPVLAEIARINDFVLIIAHRNILIKQASKLLAVAGIVHNVMATTHTRRLCMIEHRRAGLGDGFLSESNKHVCSIDSLLSRHRRGLLNIDSTKPWVILVDEAHHMLENNKWGQLLQIFPNARIIGATATPCRLDGRSLSSKKDGVFDRLVQADELKKDSCKTLIEQGYLSDFKVWSTASRIDESNLQIGSIDYTYRSIDKETRAVMFEMAGDAVKHYNRLAKDKLTLAFCASIDIAKATAQVFREAGISSAAIHSEMSSTEVDRIFKLFEAHEIKVLFSVDMVGEGTDVPAIEALIMLRKTASFGLCRQFYGRALRPSPGKEYAIIIDHVGNALTHGLPDKSIEWDLDRPHFGGRSCLIACFHCGYLQNAWETVCSECGGDIRKQVNQKRASDVKYINYSLVEMKRKKIEKKWREENIIKIRDRGCDPLAAGFIGKRIDEIRLWCAEVLEDNGAAIKDINHFFDSTGDRDFWLTSFRASDVNNAKNKPIKVFKKWLKSQ